MKVAKIKRKTKYDKGEFCQFSKEGLRQAMTFLDKNGLYLYLYLTANNGDGFKYNISPTAFANYYNMNDSTAKSIIKRGWENLVKNSFLILEKGKQDIGVFLADGPE